MNDHSEPMTVEDAYSQLINDVMQNLLELEKMPNSCCKMHFLFGVLANVNAGMILNLTEFGEEFDAVETLAEHTREVVERLLPQKIENLEHPHHQ